jgi:hypothetical protein
MCRIMHACGHTYTPGLWLGGCPWCALAPKADAPVAGRYFDLHDGRAYYSGAQILANFPHNPEVRDMLAGLRSGQSVTVRAGAAELTATRVF